MIYVFSNVYYPEGNKIRPEPDDLLVFINTARSLPYYREHKNKVVFHRREGDKYGKSNNNAKDYYLYGPLCNINTKHLIDIPYDYGYIVPAGKAKTMTTGYMTIHYLEREYPGQPITLVNFGFSVKNSTRRVANHNWGYENSVLHKYPHIYTADVNDEDSLEVVYVCDANYIEQLNMSARSVLRYNPTAHITVVSNKPLDILYDNVVVDTSSYTFKHNKNDRISSAAYLKLFLPKCLPYDKVIFIDCDTICQGSLDELKGTYIPYIGLCHSHDFGRKQALEIGIPLYGLTGVMVLNLKMLREIELTDKAMEAMVSHKFPAINWQHEETILNCCFYKLLTFIPVKYNLCYNRSYFKYDDAVSVDDAIIVHFPKRQIEAQRQFYDKCMEENS